MATKKRKKIDRTKLKSVTDNLDEFMTALGLSVLMLQQTQTALRKDAVTLRVTADQFCDSIRRLQRMQRSLRAELRQAGVE